MQSQLISLLHAPIYECPPARIGSIQRAAMMEIGNHEQCQRTAGTEPFHEFDQLLAFGPGCRCDIMQHDGNVARRTRRRWAHDDCQTAAREAIVTLDRAASINCA